MKDKIDRTDGPPYLNPPYPDPYWGTFQWGFFAGLAVSFVMNVLGFPEGVSHQVASWVLLILWLIPGYIRSSINKEYYNDKERTRK